MKSRRLNLSREVIERNRDFCESFKMCDKYNESEMLHQLVERKKRERFEIIQKFRDNNSRFIDTEFPTNDESLFIDFDQQHSFGERVYWLRPEHIQVECRNVNTQWTVYDDPKSSDIKKGLAGDCWLMSALAIIVEQPEILKNIFLRKEYCHGGWYQIRLCYNGE